MKTPTVRISAAARAAIDEAMSGVDGFLRLGVTERLEYTLSIGSRADGDIELDAGGCVLLADRDVAASLDGVSIDFIDGPNGTGFRIERSAGPRRIRQIGAHELKAMRDRGDSFELVDVRTDAERAVAFIEGSRLLDQALHDELLRMARDTTIVFQCHHGVRSQSAAEYFLQHGFSNLFNLVGGIDAWSQRVDASVPRY